jgi:hypothetical protein
MPRCLHTRSSARPTPPSMVGIFRGAVRDRVLVIGKERRPAAPTYANHGPFMVATTRLEARPSCRASSRSRGPGSIDHTASHSICDSATCRIACSPTTTRSLRPDATPGMPSSPRLAALSPSAHSRISKPEMMLRRRGITSSFHPARTA